MVLVSPGFLLTTQNLEMSAVVDRANRASVVINTIDGRGLYTPDLMGDISQASSDTMQTVGFKSSYRWRPKPNKPMSSAIWPMARVALSFTIRMISPGTPTGRRRSGNFLCAGFFSPKSKDGRPVP